MHFLREIFPPEIMYLNGKAASVFKSLKFLMATLYLNEKLT